MSTVVKVYFIFSYISELPTVTELDKTGNIYIRGSAPPKKCQKFEFFGGRLHIKNFPKFKYGLDFDDIWVRYWQYLVHIRLIFD